MSLITFSKFVRTVNFFCKTLGIKQYGETEVANLKQSPWKQLITLSIILNLVLVITGEMAFVYFSFKSGENFIETITAFTYIAFGIVASWKIITIFLKKQQLNQLVYELQELFPKTLKAQQDMQIEIHLRQCNMTSFLYSSLNMMLTWSHNLGPIIAWLFCGAEQTLPYFLLIPWNWQNHWSFFFVYALEVLAAYSSTAGQILSDLLLFALAEQVIMHYDNVVRRIETYQANIEIPKAVQKAKLDLEKQHERNFLFLQDLIAYHERVLRLSDIMNDVFGVPLLINFMTSTTILCFVGFEMTAGNADFETAVKLFLFMSSSLVQIFLISYYGQQLIDSSSNIAVAVFSHDWTNTNLRYKRNLSLIIKRAQKPAILKATTFVVVSRNTMAELMKISYNFFALLQTYYSE